MKMLAQVYVGVDVSKSWLDVCLYPIDISMRIDNSEKAIKKLITKLSQYKVEQIVCEASGGYQAILVQMLQEAKFAVWCVDPKRIKAFIVSEGMKAKTDAIDAKMIALFASKVENKHNDQNKIVSQDHAELKALVKRRVDLIAMIANEKKRLAHPQQKYCKKEIQEHINFMGQHVDKIDQEMKDIIDKDATLKQKAKLINSVKGVGPVTTAALLAEMPELGTLKKGQAAALLGVAPYTNESGTYKGKSHIRHGRRIPRNLLYMGVLGVVRFVPVYKKFYNDLIARGKKAKVALVAMMRKLIEILNIMLRDNVPWAPPVLGER